MKKIFLGFTVAIALMALGLLLASFAAAQAPDNQPALANGDDSQPSGIPEVVIPEMYRPSSTTAVQTTPVSTIYFTPQDENTSTTILFLYNTNLVTETVRLQTYYINGSLTISTTVAIPPLHLVRISADTVTTVSASWANYVLINFTTFSAYAKMTLPPGVKADGYVAWDTTGIYDPLVANNTVPIRFSTDPPTVFLPTITRNSP